MVQYEREYGEKTIERYIVKTKKIRQEMRYTRERKIR